MTNDNGFSRADIEHHLVDGATSVPPTQHIVSAGQKLLPEDMALMYVSRPGDGQVRYVFQRAVKLGDRSAWNYIKGVLSGDITEDNPGRHIPPRTRAPRYS